MIDYKCKNCGGTIGPIKKIEHKLPPNPYVIKYYECWFVCIACKAAQEPELTLIDINV